MFLFLKNINQQKLNLSGILFCQGFLPEKVSSSAHQIFPFKSGLHYFFV